MWRLLDLSCITEGWIPLANNKSAEKRIRINEKKKAENKPHRTAARSAVRRANEAIADGAEDTLEAVQAAISRLDRTASKGIIHKNNAARRKSRLMAKFNKLAAAKA